MAGAETDFEAEFARLSKLGDGEPIVPVAPPVAETPVVENAEGAPAAPADGAPAEPAPVEGEGAEGAVAEEPKEAEEPAPKAEEPKAEEPKSSPADDVLRRLAERLEASEKREEAPPPKQEPQEPEPPLFTQDEVGVLQNFQKEWPEISQAFQIAQRAQGALLARHFQQQLQSIMEPLMETVQSIAVRTQHQDLVQALPEYDDYREKVIEWALSDSQPNYLREAHQRVIREGTTDEVKHLYQRYYQETGDAPPSKQVQTPAPKKAPELPPAAKQAAKSLAPVSSKRSEIQTQEDPNDFEAGWKKWSGMDNL